MTPAPLTPRQTSILARLARITKRFDPCQLRMVAGKMTCKRPSGPCCQGCAHLGVDGCSVVAAGCRFWFCDKALRELPHIAREAIDILSHLYDGDLRYRYDGDIMSTRQSRHTIEQMNMPGWRKRPV